MFETAEHQQIQRERQSRDEKPGHRHVWSGFRAPSDRAGMTNSDRI